MNIEKQRGLSLTELMIALVIGLLFTNGMIAVFMQSKRSFNQDEIVARMQEDARFAMDELVRDIGMASFLADLLDPSAVTLDVSLAIGTDCGPGTANWMYEMIDPATGNRSTITTVDNATPAAATASFSCIAGAEIVPGTDIVGVKRVVGAPSAALDANGVYLRTNGTVGLLFREPPAVPPAVAVPVPFQDWAYAPVIFYVRNFGQTPGDGIPTLCKKTLETGAPPTMVTECVAAGIEDLQVEFGLDNDGDGAPNNYIANPTLAQLQQAISIRIYLLARGAESDIAYTNDKVYSLSNAPIVAPADNFYRRVYTTTVVLRDLKNLNRLGL